MSSVIGGDKERKGRTYEGGEKKKRARARNHPIGLYFPGMAKGGGDGKIANQKFSSKKRNVIAKAVDR